GATTVAGDSDTRPNTRARQAQASGTPASEISTRTRPCVGSTRAPGSSATARSTLRQRAASERRRLPPLRKISPKRQRMTLPMRRRSAVAPARALGDGRDLGECGGDGGRGRVDVGGGGVARQ